MLSRWLAIATTLTVPGPGSTRWRRAAATVCESTPWGITRARSARRRGMDAATAADTATSAASRDAVRCHIARTGRRSAVHGVWDVVTSGRRPGVRRATTAGSGPCTCTTSNRGSATRRPSRRAARQPTRSGRFCRAISTIWRSATISSSIHRHGTETTAVNVLGISGRYRDAAAALAIDGQVTAAASEDCTRCCSCSRSRRSPYSCRSSRPTPPRSPRSCRCSPRWRRCWE